MGAGLALRLANELAATLALLHGSLRVQRTHARGHLVTGASPATSPRGDGYGEQGGGGYGKQTKAGLGGRGPGAHHGHEEMLGEVGDGPEPANLTKMAGGSEVEDDGDGGDAGFRRAVDRWGGRGGRGGAPWGVGEAWGARWLRQSASVAAAPLGSEVRSERESRRRG